jgi:hypothetical protein
MPTITNPKTYNLIVEDHAGAFEWLSNFIKQIDSESEILHAQTPQQALDYINSYHDRLNLVSIDLGLSQIAGDINNTCIKNGIDLLRTVLEEKPNLNIVVNTGSSSDKLKGLKNAIIDREGGFVFLDKLVSDHSLILDKLRIAKHGGKDDKTIKSELGNSPMKPQWLEALRLAAEGCDNAAIFKKMRPNEEYDKNKHWKTIDNYLRNAGKHVLNIETEDGFAFRVRLIKVARDEGWLD